MVTAGKVILWFKVIVLCPGRHSMCSVGTGSGWTGLWLAWCSGYWALAIPIVLACAARRVVVSTLIRHDLDDGLLDSDPALFYAGRMGAQEVGRPSDSGRT